MDPPQQPQPQQPELPPGWTSGTSRKHNKTFYHHAASGTSVWSLAEVEAVERSRRQAAVEAAEQPQPQPQPLAQPPVRARQRAPAPSSSTTTTTTTTYVTPEEAAARELAAQTEDFRRMVRSRLSGMMSDPEATHVAFDPCSADLRFIISEEAQDMDLPVEMDGVDEDAHMVVYRPGHSPSELEAAVPAEAELELSQHRRKKRRPGDGAPPPIDVAGGVQVLGTVKRDRRTIEEIEMEKKRERAAVSGAAASRP